MSENFNKLSNKNTELISLLIEEAGEIVQIGGKILRHGLDSYNPFDYEMIRNRDLIAKEIGDLLGVMDVLINTGVLDKSVIDSCRDTKIYRSWKFLHHIEDIEDD